MGQSDRRGLKRSALVRPRGNGRSSAGEKTCFLKIRGLKGGRTRAKLRSRGGSRRVCRREGAMFEEATDVTPPKKQNTSGGRGDARLGGELTETGPSKLQPRLRNTSCEGQGLPTSWKRPAWLVLGGPYSSRKAHAKGGAEKKCSTALRPAASRKGEGGGHDRIQ